jgi:hypothetical protein
MKAKDSAHLQTNNALSVEPGRDQRTTMKRRKKTDPTTRLIEAMLDIALLARLYIRNGVLSSACLLSRDTPRSRAILFKLLTLLLRLRQMASTHVTA